MSNQSGSGNGIAVVTGASAGLGKIYADRLAKRKYDLLLVARRRERLDALTSELEEKYGVRVQSIVADLGNLPDLKKVSDVIGTDERVTLLVNCAGTSAVTPLVNMTLPDVDRLMDVNMRSLTHLSLAVLPGFLKRNQGHDYQHRLRAIVLHLSREHGLQRDKGPGDVLHLGSPAGSCWY